MSRPFKQRRVAECPTGKVFKPAGVPFSALAKITLQIDELEALRQSFLLHRHQEQGAVEMGISRSTFARILESALIKVTDALTGGKALVIEGGPVIMARRTFVCHSCQHVWEEPFGSGRPEHCPNCRSAEFHRSDAGPRGMCVKGKKKAGEPNTPSKENKN